MEVGLIILVALTAAALLVLIATWPRGRQVDVSPLNERLDSLNRELGKITGQASTYQDTISSVNQALGGLTQTSQRILEVGQDMQKLQEVLAAPTLRGSLGELMLEQLLRKMLPKDHYEIQHTFRNGHRVDAVIRLADGLVPVDAKFPLEAFRHLIEAGDAERRRYTGEFYRDVKGHIDAIAEKYICPGETLDFAIMYIPAENVYYEIILKQEGQEDILEYARDRRVITTSPNSFYAYLQVIALGLRGLQVEQNAKRMIESLTRLKNDFDRFADDYRLVGTHLGRAQSKYSEGLPKLESIQRALPGQLTSMPSIQGPEAEEATGEGAEEASKWEYGPQGSRRGRRNPE